jgi:hypothetical protein
MTTDIDKIIAIQAEQLMKYHSHPKLLHHVLEIALQRNYEANPCKPTINNVWRGQEIDSAVIRQLTND